MTNKQVEGANLGADLQHEFKEIISKAYRISTDVGREVEEVLRRGKDQPLSGVEARQLLTRVVEILRAGAVQRSDQVAIEALAGDIQEITGRISKFRESSTELPKKNGFSPLIIRNHNGIEMTPVRPSPWFHEKEIPMMAGFVQTRNIKLWDKNERLDIHLNQFHATYGRSPKPDELLDIMLSKLKLPGIEKTDAFSIVELARSIANNGVRKPPIL
ncbi:MAG TPA: hypothetical protein VFB79_24285, partial [Candidatus Angelobacter sp.]|nr:hypothetical protein [Candidatus Angelobacter sp.]